MSQNYPYCERKCRFCSRRGYGPKTSICECPKVPLASCSRCFTHLVFIKSFCPEIYVLELSSSCCKTLTLIIIEEVSVSVSINITCHLKYDSTVTAGPWGCLCVGTAIWLPQKLPDNLLNASDPEIINMALEVSAFSFCPLVV